MLPERWKLVYSGGDWSGTVAIEVRGSSSARDNAKKSFAFETRAENGSNLDAPVFGAPPLLNSRLLCAAHDLH
jgi:hypothetical protein